MSKKGQRLNRRDFIKGMGLGLAGIASLGWNRIDTSGGSISASADADLTGLTQDLQHAASHLRSGRLYRRMANPAKVSLFKGENRYDIVFKSLKAIEDQVIASIGNKRILLKPNVVLSECPLCVTHVDAVRAVLDFLRPHYKKQIIIGESGVQDTALGFKNYGYYPLEKDYDVKIVDLNLTPSEYRYVLGKDNKPLPIRIISAFLDPDTYIISLARMKTHNYVVVTLSLKNVIMASPLNEYGKQNDKGFMHVLPAAVNDLCHYNMFHIGQEVYPDLAVIDGYEGMEGNGPAWGTPILSKIALASLDPLAADITATRIMGFDPKRVNYLMAMAEAGFGQSEPEKIQLVGTPFSECLCKYKPNEGMAKLYGF